MAYTKKTSKNNDIVESKEAIHDDIMEVESAQVTEAAQAPKKAIKIKHDPDELIPCRSLIFGKLLIVGPKTKTLYEWSNEGDVREVEYQDLLSLKVVRSQNLFAPRIIIEDEDIRNEWSSDLGKVYKGVEDVSIRELFELPQRQFAAKLKSLPAGLRSSMQDMAYAMIKEGTLYDLRKIKTIDEEFGTTLVMMI